MKKIILANLILFISLASYSQNTYLHPSDTLVKPSFFESSNLLVNWEWDYCPVRVVGTDTTFVDCYNVTFRDTYSASIDLCPSNTSEVGGIGLFNGVPRLLDNSLFTDMEADGSNIISNTNSTSINYKNLTTGTTTSGGGPNPKYCIEADLYLGNENAVWYHQYQILAGPINKPGSTYNYHTAETIGILIDGMVLEHTPPSSESVSALQGGIIPLDRCGFHPEPSGFGHFHTIPHGINLALAANGVSSDYYCEDVDQLENSGLAGFSFEGIPIYAPYDNGENTAPNDLDECNGHTGATVEFPNGVYHYHASATDIINNPPCRSYFAPLEDTRYEYGEFESEVLGIDKTVYDANLVSVELINKTIVFTGNFEVLEVFNTEGKTIFKIKNGSQPVHKNIEQYLPGIYFISAKLDNKYCFKKILFN
ncbi:hypothetical protein AXE80_03655 [Wenyingzhuangia fucanilytica]|uniref:YHYH domain-containing protein n=1 Tax=Wenyingzhuangia fucanilytica TaxID=1790137 RepID=A0A1B1Y3W4_9FLAO|nr:YHYH protein [Wenyingzhuangia fucanilytica]ANW95429.1 hypothetical protein AXE80_03655 [Wenyingzhuangia fucanilytica]